MSQDQNIKVIAICGSLRERGFTKKALAIALTGASNFNVETELIELRKYNLPFCDPSSDTKSHPQVLYLSQKIKKSHGIILGTPEYHGSFSGVLKNFLDLMGFDEFEGKMIGLIGVAGGSLGAINALHDLRSIGRQLHAWVIPSQASIPRAHSAFDGNTLIDKKLEKRIMDVGSEVAKFAILHNSQESFEFLKAWQEAPINPGGTKYAT